jgi:hypothetical protein
MVASSRSSGSLVVLGADWLGAAFYVFFVGPGWLGAALLWVASGCERPRRLATATAPELYGDERGRATR